MPVGQDQMQMLPQTLEEILDSAEYHFEGARALARELVDLAIGAYCFSQAGKGPTPDRFEACHIGRSLGVIESLGKIGRLDYQTPDYPTLPDDYEEPSYNAWSRLVHDQCRLLAEMEKTN